MTRPVRDYSAIAARVSPRGDRATTMQQVVDCLWEGLRDQGVSWVGFYTKDPTGDQLVLGPRRDKPACSPIGLYGVCGQAYLGRRAKVIADVASLGPNYVACDPRDRSEIVVPLFEDDGTCWGVLDLDSFDVGAFDGGDVEELSAILSAAGFRTGPAG